MDVPSFERALGELFLGTQGTDRPRPVPSSLHLLCFSVEEECGARGLS